MESSPSTTSVCKDVHLQNIDKVSEWTFVFITATYCKTSKFHLSSFQSKSIQPGQQQLVLNIDSSNVKLPNELEFGRHHSDSSDSEVDYPYFIKIYSQSK